MIRKLEEQDRYQVLEYLNQEPSLNIFIIGDIEHFGFDNEFQTTFGEFNEEGGYESVLLFYRKNLVYYAHKNRFNKDYLPIMSAFEFDYANTSARLAKLLHAHLPTFTYKEMFFAEARNFQASEPKGTTKIKQLKTRNEMTKLYHLLEATEEFEVASQPIEEFIDGKMKGLSSGVTLFVEEDGAIISTAATTAETTTSAMVVGVATSFHHRNKGLASKLMTSLMEQYFNKNKYLCLFYDNPAAGNIYKRLGFVNIDKWVMMVREK